MLYFVYEFNNNDINNIQQLAVTDLYRSVLAVLVIVVTDL